MTTTDPASMGEPLSEAERGISVEAIRSRVDHQLKLDRSVNTLAARNLAEAVDDRAYLLRRHDLLADAYEHAKEQKAKYEQRVIGWREQCSLATRERDAALVNARQLQERLDAATARVGVLEGQLATARASLIATAVGSHEHWEFIRGMEGKKDHYTPEATAFAEGSEKGSLSMLQAFLEATGEAHLDDETTAAEEVREAALGLDGGDPGE